MMYNPTLIAKQLQETLNSMKNIRVEIATAALHNRDYENVLKPLIKQDIDLNFIFIKLLDSINSLEIENKRLTDQYRKDQVELKRLYDEYKPQIDEEPGCGCCY